MPFIDLPDVEVRTMYNVQALLKPCSGSAVTSPFSLTLGQGISRGAVEAGHNTAGVDLGDEGRELGVASLDFTKAFETDH